MYICNGLRVFYTMHEIRLKLIIIWKSSFFLKTLLLTRKMQFWQTYRTSLVKDLHVYCSKYKKF